MNIGTNKDIPMKTYPPTLSCLRAARIRGPVRISSLLILLALGFLAASRAGAATTGTWTQLSNQPPVAVGHIMLLTDGTVLAQEQPQGVRWFRLKPDSSGS